MNGNSRNPLKESRVKSLKDFYFQNENFIFIFSKIKYNIKQRRNGYANKREADRIN